MPKPQSFQLQSWRSHLLSAIDSSSHLRHLHQILSQSFTSGLWLLDPFLSSRIIAALTSSHLPTAHLAFLSSHNPSPFAFNSLIRAHSNGSTPSLSLLLFRLMLRSSLYPDRFTFPFLLRSSPTVAPTLHSIISRHGLDRDPHIATSLLHSYASSGLLDSARRVFDEMPERTTVTWNAIVSCFSKFGSLQEEGLYLFVKMLSSSTNVQPNVDTFIGALACCAGQGALACGRSIHGIAVRWLGHMSAALGSALIHMYSKCGSLDSGRRVFEMVEGKDVSIWTTMIGGLAMHGCPEEAVGMFERMVERERMTPDSLTFTSVLHACSHSGLVEKGIRIFHDMSERFKIEARMEHYGALVDLLGRAGRLEEAEQVVKSMPFEPNRVVWGSLLHACIVHGELEFGKRLEKQCLELGVELVDGSGFCVGVSNVYAKNGRWDEVGRVRSTTMEKGVRKESGFSLIEVNG